MKLFIFSISLLFTSFLFAQDTFSEKDAKHVIDTFFEGFHKGDTIQMKSVILGNIATQTVFASKDGSNRIVDSMMDGFIKAIGNRPEADKWEERLLDYNVQIDGNLAHVWTPYEFWLNDKFSHCGANAFTLAKTDEGWKIVHLIDSRRRDSCKQE